MTDRQHGKLDDYGSVETVLDAHPDPLAGVPAAQRAIGDFRTRLGLLRAAARGQAGYAPQGKAKDAQLDALADAAVPLSQAVAAWAEDEGDVALADQIAFDASDFDHARDQDALDRAALVHAAARDRLDALVAEYGVSKDDVEALGGLVKAFGKALGRPRHAVVERMAHTEAIERLVPEIERVLDRRLDRHVARFKGTPFYAEYHAARRTSGR